MNDFHYSDYLQKSAKLLEILPEPANVHFRRSKIDNSDRHGQQALFWPHSLRLVKTRGFQSRVPGSSPGGVIVGDSAGEQKRAS